MTILQVVASYKPAFIYGGPIVSVASICEALVEKGVDLEVLTTTANGSQDFDRANREVVKIENVNVRYFGRITKDHSHFSPALYGYLFANLQADKTVHIQAWWNLVSVGAAFVCKIKGKKFILSPRGTLSSYSFINRTSAAKKLFHKLFGKWLISKAVFQVSSQKEVGDIEYLFPGAKTFVIPNFIDLSGAEAVLQNREEISALRIVFFSRIEEKKGLNFLLQSLEHLKIPFILDIYGEGDENYIKQLSQTLSEKVQIFVSWKGAIYGAKKFNILASYDIMVLPSYDENFANIVVECLAVGTPVLLTEKVGLSDYVLSNNLGWICTQDPVNIAKVLNDIYLDAEKRQAIRDNAPGLVFSDFSRENLSKQYLGFYAEVVPLLRA